LGGHLGKHHANGPYLTAPLISQRVKKSLDFFLVKELFFSIGKKGRGLTAPLISQKMFRRGAVRWVCTDIMHKI